MKSLIVCAARVRRAHCGAQKARPHVVFSAYSLSHSVYRVAAHKVCALVVALALLVSMCPAAAFALNAASAPELPTSPAEVPAASISAYGDGDPLSSAEFQVTCAIYGPDLAGVSVPWAVRSMFTVKDGATAADLTRLLIAQAKLSADAQQTQYGFYLASITSPFTGAALGWDAATNKYWQLFVNGAVASVGADQVVLKPNTSVVWSYARDGEDEPIIQPDIHEGDIPVDYPSAWAGFTSGNKNGAVITNIATPTQTAQAGWIFDPFKDNPATGGFDMRGVSDPLIVGASGDIYMLAGSSIFKIDAQTGAIKTSKQTGFPATYYFSRPAYHAGLIFAAADDGRVAAFAADTLDRVWCTQQLSAPAQDAKYQNLASIIATQGKVYAAFTVVGGANRGIIGTLVCIDERSGNVLWTTTESARDDGGAGYYWAGACSSGTDLMIADESGSVKLIAGTTGVVKAQLSIGHASRSNVIALDDVDAQGNGTYLVVSRADATLHKIVRRENMLSEQGALSFTATSTSSPAVARGKIFVCGCDEENYGTLSVIDLATMTLEKTVRGSRGAAQSSPLVSVQGSDIYAYFTCNNRPGGVYAYKLGDAQASLIFTPQESDQQYCTASLIADSKGNLYYANDSKKLFKLVGGSSVPTPGQDDTSDGNTTNQNGSAGGAGGSGSGSGAGGSGSGAATGGDTKRNADNADVPLMTMQSNTYEVQEAALEETPRTPKDAKLRTSTQSDPLSAEANASANDDVPTPAFPFLALVGAGVAVIALIVAVVALSRRAHP